MIELLPHDRRVIGQFHEDRLAAAADAVVQTQADVEPVGLACQIERVAVAEGQYGEFLFPFFHFADDEVRLLFQEILDISPGDAGRCRQVQRAVAADVEIDVFHFLADQDDREGPALGRELVLFARHGNTSQK